MTRNPFLFACLCFLAVAGSAVAVPPPPHIEVYPDKLTLDSARAYRQLVVSGYYDGEPRDLTTEAKFQSSDSKIAAIDGTRIVAASDGQASITIEVAGQSIQVPVIVSNTSKPDPVQFKFETTAVLTKQGCATGSCHGSPHGKGSFSLSLFGYDPSIDRISLTRDAFNRRVNILEPAESLMLKKPLMELSHVGGKRLLKSDAAYRILYDWIYEGADTTLPAVECQQISVYPGQSRILKAPFLKQQINVLARYTDGTIRDVTKIATYTSSNQSVAEVSANGLVTGKSRGQAAISVRYLDKLESINVTMIEEIPGFVWTNPTENNFVDHLVNEKLRQLQFLPAETCGDAVFIRRAYLDLTGLLPMVEVSRAFLADASPDKRAKLIDRLLDSEDYARFWALKKADLMRVTSRVLKDGRADLFANWIINAQRKNIPYDQFARQILTASGTTREVAPANYYEAVPTMEERTEMTAEIFMGSRLECAKCHNHPFENWTMKDYYSLGAVFARTQDDSGEVTLLETGETKHPTTGQPMTPWGMPATSSGSVSKSDRRQIFADWLTAKGNPFFARVEVNRIWAALFGRGIVDPIDDFRSSNPPSNGPLLDALAAEFEKSGYDRKHIIRLICNSQTYQRSTQTSKFNEGDETLFSHAKARLLSAEQLQDAIAVTSGALSPMPVVERVLATARQDLQSRESEMDREYSAWLRDAEQRAKVMPTWAGMWYSIGPFKFTGDPVKEEFGPEKHPVDLTESFGKPPRAWQLRLDFQDAATKQVVRGTKNVVNYFYRRIFSDDERTLDVQFQCPGGAMVWLNQERITFKPYDGKKPLTLKLKTGDNHLLIKLVTRTDNNFSFTVKAPASRNAKPPLPGYVAELLTLSAAARSDVQCQAIREHYLMTDSKYRELRERIPTLQNRTAYATQRAVPDSSAFLTTFGQPQRQSACTCERSNSPTLLQALELLNGATVSRLLGYSATTYAKLEDDKLIDELYLASYSRLPTDKERGVSRDCLKNATTRTTAVADLVWAIVNTREFMFQH